MSYLIKKSKYLIILIILISVFTTLLVSLISKRYEISKYNPCDFPDDYAKFNIGLQRNEQVENTSLLDLISYINSNSKFDYTLLKEKNRYYGIYARGSVPKLNILEGRNLKEEDFIEDNYVMVLNNDHKNDSFKRDGKTYYMMDNQPYEVVGFYEDLENHETTDGIYNLLAENNEESGILGDFYLDGKSKTKSIQSLIQKRILCTITKDADKKLGWFEKLYEVLSSGKFVVLPLLLILVIQCMNFFIFSTNWLNDRKRERKIKIMYGATRKGLCKEFCLEFLLVVYVTFFICFFAASLLSLTRIWNLSRIGFSFASSFIYISVCTLVMEMGIVITFIKEGK